MKNNGLRKVSRIAIAMIGCFALFLMLAGGLLAQERTGVVQGTVADASGAMVPGASVEVAGTGLIQPLTVVTDGSGTFYFASVPPGTYTLTVSSKGFNTVKRSDIQVLTGRSVRLDMKLEVSSVTESVVVEASGVIVDTASTNIATNVTSDTYDRLPKGRSWDSLVMLAPGVRNEPRQAGISVDGASAAENAYILDGMEVTNIQNGDLDRNVKVPIEWIGETNVKSTSDAQYGGALGGVVIANTKSGSNEFHGQGSMYYEGDAMDANPRQSLRLSPFDDEIAEYFYNKKDSYRRLNPGFAVGGRIIRDKIWFFTSYYPQINRTNRAVNFNDGNKGSYESNTRQDFFMGRIDTMPWQKLRLNASYFYNPYRVMGTLPSRQGTDAFDAPWNDIGSRTPWTGINYQADWTATNKFVLSVFGGYNYQNYKSYGVPRGTFLWYATPSSRVTGVPPQYQGPSGARTYNNTQTAQDIFERNNIHVIASYLLNAGGQHNIRVGYDLNRLANRPSAADSWVDGYLRVFWGTGYNAITKPPVSGGYRGQYGYYRNRVFGTFGDVSSSNQGIFFQDSWRVSKKLQLNIGLRTEREYLPSFSVSPDLQSDPISFSWGDKFAPRLGFAYDPSGVGKMKIYGSWGMYYDIMKYEMPRGSFGGDIFKDYYYTLDSPDLSRIQITPGSGGLAGTFPGTFIETLDRRIPSNSKDNNLIDPSLKPVRTQVYDFGYEYSLTDKWLMALRYTHRGLDRTIEDVGILTPLGEQYYITNPGFGFSADPSKFPSDYPKPANPKAKRDYDGVEFRVEKRFSNNFSMASSYTWSRLYGNYGGLGSSDENGRLSPNVNRYFDEAWMNYDDSGKLVYGRLATDRPHTFKFFGSYDLKSKVGLTRFAPAYVLYAGTPLTTEMDVQDVPVFVNGRGDLGRTSIYNNMDLLISHDIPVKSSEKMKFRLELNVTNLFNGSAVLNKWITYSHANDGAITFDNTGDIFKGYNYINMMKDAEMRVDPRFFQASDFQVPRSMRLGLHFFF